MLFIGKPMGRSIMISNVHIHIYIYITKKDDRKQCENWRRESGSEFHKISPTCERGECRKQLQDFSTQGLKQTPLGSCAISNLFWPNGIYI